jgi:alginate O-acetyltransferase complex protein AlgI
MAFNSLFYLFFLAIVVILFYVFPGKLRWVWLLIASTGYYLTFIPVFLLLLAGMVLVNYFLAIWLSKVHDKKADRSLIFIIISNIIILAFFKYFHSLFPGIKLHLFSFDFYAKADLINSLILPLGLSYFTFTVMSYQIEVKRKTIQPETHFGYFSIYLLFFPKIAQGPIERPLFFLPQLHKRIAVNYDLIAEGFKLMLWGYFKKIVVADRLALYVNAVYNNPEDHNGTTLILATIFFAFQVYADFSGYTDIALGSAKLFGIDLTSNFKRPYFATSVKEFWDRWHITFSTWLRDYLFLPLAYFFAHRMKKQKYLYVSSEKWIYLFSIMITFAVCGLWHGVGWTYLAWGILFGIYLSYANFTKDLHRIIRKRLKIKKTSNLYLFYKVLSTFLLVTFAWIFFRADSINEALYFIKKAFTSYGVPYLDLLNLAYSFIGIAIILMKDYKDEYHLGKIRLLSNKSVWIRYVSYLIIIFMIILMGVSEGSGFVYFQF